MTSEEDNTSPSTKITTDRPGQQLDPEDLVVEDNAKEDAEKSADCGKRENRKEKEAPDDNNPLGRVRLLFIWIGLWFAVFLYSLVSLS